MSVSKQSWRLWLLISGLCWFAQLARADLWCSGYFPGYEQGSMPASNIDFSVVTHVIHFSVIPNAGGSVNTNANVISPAYTADVVSHAHASNRKALICVGGANTSANFESVVSNTYLSTFVMNLTNFMAVGGYDGIDVDWEPLNDLDKPLFTNFVTRLRAAMDQFSTHKLLTVAVPTGTTPSLVAAVQAKFDQINLMTYDLSGPYGGWVTWYNSPIYNEGFTFPSVPGEYVPCVDSAVTNFLGGGIPTNLLGIGIPFYGDVWKGGTGTSTGGATQPDQSWTTAPTMTAYTYNQIVSSGYTASQYHYDAGAQASYVSVTNAVATNDMFISYEDQRACEAKVSYARNRGLGGFIIWELSQDHQANKPDPLLEAIKQTLATPGMIALQGAGQTVSPNFTSAPLGSYRVQWSSNLTTWNSLMVTNVSLTWTGGVIQATDSLSGQGHRFYRVKTPL
jgi:chitinase